MHTSPNYERMRANTRFPWRRKDPGQRSKHSVGDPGRTVFWTIPQASPQQLLNEFTCLRQLKASENEGFYKGFGTLRGETPEMFHDRMFDLSPLEAMAYELEFALEFTLERQPTTD